jgi:hypothetical protein
VGRPPGRLRVAVVDPDAFVVERGFVCPTRRSRSASP